MIYCKLRAVFIIAWTDFTSAAFFAKPNDLGNSLEFTLVAAQRFPPGPSQ
jgi:hypothetical protein